MCHISVFIYWFQTDIGTESGRGTEFLDIDAAVIANDVFTYK